MIFLFQVFIFIFLIDRSLTQPIGTLDDEGFPIPKTETEPLCLICQDEQQRDKNDQEVNFDTLYEYDKTLGVDNLDEIENEVRLINSTAWLQEPIFDTKNWKDEVAKFRDTYLNMDVDEANKRLESLKIKGNAFAIEKNANKDNALKKWRRIPIIRIRIHKIEQRLLDANNFGENIQALEHIDQIRNLANEASKELREVYEHYGGMDREVFESNNVLMSIEDKLNAKREKEGKVRRSKCFWIFCY